MPMYEYRCDACGKVTERYASGKDVLPGDDRCPSCGKGRLTKIFSTFASSCCGDGASSSTSSGGCGGGSSHFS